MTSECTVFALTIPQEYNTKLEGLPPFFLDGLCASRLVFHEIQGRKIVEVSKRCLWEGWDVRYHEQRCAGKFQGTLCTCHREPQKFLPQTFTDEQNQRNIWAPKIRVTFPSILTRLICLLVHFFLISSRVLKKAFATSSSSPQRPWDSVSFADRPESNSRCQFQQCFQQWKESWIRCCISD